MKTALIFIAGAIVGALLTVAINSQAAPTACFPLNKQQAINVCMGGKQ